MTINIGAHVGYADLVPILHPWADAALDLAGAAADIDDSSTSERRPFRCGKDLIVTQLIFTVTVAVVATTTDPEVALDWADYDGVTNRTEIDTLTIPDTTAAGVVLIQDVNYGNGTAVAEGSVLIREHTVQCVGGVIAGAGVLQFLYRLSGN
ncbi:MAG: hypothetical protein JSW71_10230 [Gemmatimonadota bacterium]|nr:MAG: hypothetical protein JSW71_10230 [Gemmatimonadota bacterium]